MDSLFILIPVALIFVVVAVRAFIWAVNSHQYDDLDSAANSILFDDDAEVEVSEELKEARDDKRVERDD